MGVAATWAWGSVDGEYVLGIGLGFDDEFGTLMGAVWLGTVGVRG